MGRTLLLECNAGISGDMTVAALLDLGADEEKLRRVLTTVPEQNFSVKTSRVKKAGLDCMDFDVLLDKEHENHDHDMSYLYGHHEHAKNHVHMEEHTHAEKQDHGQEAHHHAPHAHRSLADVMAILAETEMTGRARRTAERIFRILGEAEAKAHGTTLEEVHFHEVGAIDSIVDIVSAAVCLDDLDIDRVIVPSVCEGTGTIRCAHGILPVPVPAVVNIVSAWQIPLHITQVKGELVTPTGAAILAAVTTGRKLPEQMVIEAVGMGAGKREYEIPGILRASLIRELSDTDRTDTIWKLESDIDDTTGEMLGYTMEQLFAAGARDVHYFPVYMKKNRPAWQLNVVCTQEKIPELEEIIYRETTTIGIRRLEMERSVLPREIRQVETVWGPVDVKVCLTGRGRKMYPEYETARKIALQQQIPLTEVYDQIRELCRRDLQEDKA